jgi:cobalt-zinc-cadmium efflux system membrane fusion protein
MHAKKKLVLLALAVAAQACSRATPTKATPAATVEKKITDGDLIKLTLTPEAETRLAIATAKAEQKDVRRKRKVGGEIVVPSGGALILAAPVAATVSASAKVVKTGTAVKRGDPLVTLVPLAPVDRDLRGQADRSTIAAEARFTAAKAKLERAEKVLADGAGTQRAVEEARAEHDVAKADLDAAKQRATSMVTSPLGADVTVTIRAPHDGVVRQVGASPGQSVAAGTVLVEVVGTSALWVRVPVFVAEARRVQPDAPATVLAFGSDERQEALPAHAAPVADPVAATVDLTYELASTQGFRQGERVEVELTYAGVTSALVVPASAIVRDAHGDAWLYEALGNHVFARRRVDLAGIQGDDAIVARGLRPGMAVVRTGAAELWGVELGAGK